MTALNRRASRRDRSTNANERCTRGRRRLSRTSPRGTRILPRVERGEVSKFDFTVMQNSKGQDLGIAGFFKQELEAPGHGLRPDQAARRGKVAVCDPAVIQG